jgi:pyruvate dehydrogenase E2 component (dihydrolipoamide acetyltransferase)
MPELRMPKMGDSMEEGTILRWLKREGDEVKAEEPIAEVETDKANVEITTEEAGKLTQIVAQEGQTVPVGGVIAVIGNGATPTPPPPSAREEGEKKQEKAATPPPSRPSAPSEKAEDGKRKEEAVAPSERVKASPLARRKAREMGLDLAQVKGTGPGGRIVERDIAAFAEKGGAAAPTPTPPPKTGEGLAAPAAPSLAGQDADISRMRRAIARRTVLSKQTVPHFYVTMPVEMDRAMDMLAQMNEQNPDRKVTVNDLIVKACAVALAKLPDVNVSFTPEEKVRHYDTIAIGIAVGTDDGLRIPVIPDCGSKTLRQIAAEAKTLIGKARDGTITPQEMSGGTFSVTNMGMFGVEEFAAIINPPESAILAVGAVMPEVVVGEDGGFVARRRMRVTLSCDHRTVDGLLGAKFLQEVKRLLENPLNLLA